MIALLTAMPSAVEAFGGLARVGSELMAKRLFFLMAVVGLLIPSLACAADGRGPEGFTSLFNGQDLAGWKVPDRR